MLHPPRWVAFIVLLSLAATARGEGDWETTPEADLAVERGLEWLARNQGSQGNWESNDLGLVSMGTLAFLSAGHMPGRGKYGENVERSIQYILRNAKPSGLLNVADGRRDMYNHGLATFVMGQAHGMTGDPQIGRVLDRALKLIYNTQCRDGGWDYVAQKQERGHDLSLAVMQAKAIRSAVDSGLEVPPEVVDIAIKSVLEHYKANNGARGIDDPKAKQGPGQFTYDGNRATTAMAAAGVVCLQEFGRYDDWRIEKNMEVITKDVHQHVQQFRQRSARTGAVPFDSYTLYYVGQALYQVGGNHWKESYPGLRDFLVESQTRNPGNPLDDGWWKDTRHVSGKPGQLYGTAVSVFILSMPNRYLPILQEGKIESLKKDGAEK